MHKLAVIEDNRFVREAILDILSNIKNLEIKGFDSPQAFLVNGKKYDYIISDWNFGHVTLEFFLNDIDRDKLVILSGSLNLPHVDCLKVISKGDAMMNLDIFVTDLLKHSRNRFSCLSFFPSCLLLF